MVFDREKCDALYQVCAELHSDNKKREIDGLLEAMTFFGLEKGFIRTENQSDDLVVEGKQITLIPAWKWMVEKEL